MHVFGNLLGRARRRAKLAAAVAAALPATALATTTNWIDGSGNWSVPGNWSNGVPGPGAAANIVETDGVNRVINYDVSSPILGIGVLTVNLAGGGGGTATTAISMSANGLTNDGEVIGGVVGGPAGGTGAFIQSGGVHLDLNALNLGFNPNDNGYYSLSGTGTLYDSYYELVGVNGTGTFFQSGGLNSIDGTADLVLGDFAASAGTYTLAAGSLYSTFAAIVGNSGKGTFIQSGGVNNEPLGLYVAYAAGSTGSSYTLSAGTLNSADGEIIGNTDTGTFVQSGGVNNSTVADTVDVGEFAPGSYTLSGTGSLYAALGENIGVSSNGAFNQSGGTNTVGTLGELVLGQNAGATGSYTLSGGTLAATDGEVIGNAGAGSFVQMGGTNTASTLALFLLGAEVGATGSYTLSGGTLTAHGENVGYFGNGTFLQTGGTNNEIGGQPFILTDLAIGGFGTGSYTLSGGNLSASGEEIAYFGSATFVQTGGANTVADGQTMIIGSQAGSYGSYSLSGGTVLATGDTYVGFAGNGILNVSGGVFTCEGSIQLYTNFLNAPSSGVLNLSGGTIVTSNLYLAGAPAEFNWSGGTLELTSSQTFDPLAIPSFPGVFGSSLLLGSNQMLIIAGDETLGGTGSFSLELGAGSNHSVSGTLAVTANSTLTQDPGSSLFAATLIQYGTINGRLQNQGNFIYQGGAFNGELINQGLVTLGPAFTASGGIENDASMDLTAGELVTVNGIGLDNLGSFSLGGATLSGSGPVVNDFSGVMQAHGSINNSFTNLGMLTVDGVLHLNGGGVNQGILTGSGTIFGAFSNVGGNIVLPSGNLLSISSPWTNGGLVTLSGGVLGGGTSTNTSTISGYGSVSATVNNNAGVIRASGGELDLLAAGDTNGPAGQIQAPAGGSVVFTQGLSANAGTITLTGGTFDNNNKPITNTGFITGFGTFRSGGLTNNGTFNLSGSSTLFGAVVNNTTLHVSGASQALFFGAVSNGGLVQVDAGSTAAFSNTFTGSGPLINNGLVTIGALSTSGTISGGGGLVIGSASAPATLHLATGSGTSRQTGQLINGGSTLDIANNALAINFGAAANDPVSTIAGYLASGYAGGAWTGTGIDSSTAASGKNPILSVGYADGNVDNGTPAAANQVLVKYTLGGDANLDGNVNSADLLAVVQNFNKTGTDWSHGNFTYVASGPSTTSADLLLVVQNFNKTLAPAGSSGDLIGGTTLSLSALAQGAAVRVPEPGSAAIAALSAAFFMRRRRRQMIWTPRSADGPIAAS